MTIPRSVCFTQLAIEQVILQILTRSKKVGCNVTWGDPLRPVKMLRSEDFSHSES
ncbi:MAG: hypothetical protein LH628_26685 [Microcoleus sp. CAN_BIN18]|nr:hypothetical protein [Microcoleus sp. CAN_BIN18]